MGGRLRLKTLENTSMNLSKAIFLFGVPLLLIAPQFAAAEAESDLSPESRSFESMLKDAVSQRDHFLLAKAMHPALEQLSEENLERAVAIVENHSDRIYRMHAFRLLARYWAAIDPVGALEYSNANLTEAEKVGPMSVALQSWARFDPEAAISWAREHVLGEFRSSVFEGAVGGWASVDLSAAAKYVRIMPEGIDRERSMRQIAKAQLHEGAKVFEKWIGSIENPTERESAIGFASRYGRFDPDLVAMLERLRDSTDTSASGPEKDSGPENSAFENLLKDAVSQKDIYLFGKGMMVALEQLNETNLESAIAIVERYSDRIHRMHAFDSLVRHWAMIDPVGAVEYSLENFNGEEVSYPLSAALHSWARHDPEAAIDWAEKNVLGKFQRSIFQGAILGWVLVDLLAATEYVRTMPPGIDREWSIRRIAKAYLHDGPEAFENWLATVDDPAEKKIAIDTGASWGRFDAELSAVIQRLKEAEESAALAK